MNMRVALAAVAAGAVTLCASAAVAAPLVLDKKLILAEHNKYRAAVGSPPITWSDKLAEGAQHWADTIALLGEMKHSGTSEIGENLAFWRTSTASLSTMIRMWEQEKQLFQPGTFPNVSRDGNWLSVSHYSQMVWRRTTQVGCGIGNNGKNDFLVCWYSPQGNYIGQAPY
ncbi:MAG TPA: CAP family protein [Rhizomicrobium sp.]|jgi:hypothetical protein|nr:CAP family protein [Rhizomicrobium sp.]